MIKLSANYGLKVPGSEKYSSRCAGASIEIEVDDLSPQAAKEKLAALWAALRESVEQELHGEPAPSSTNGNSTYKRGSYQPANRHRGNAPATKKQLGYLLSLARTELGYSPSEASDWVQHQFQTSLDSMSKHEAGRIIEHLKANQAA